MYFAAEVNLLIKKKYFCRKKLAKMAFGLKIQCTKSEQENRNHNIVFQEKLNFWAKIAENCRKLPKLPKIPENCRKSPKMMIKCNIDPPDVEGESGPDVTGAEEREPEEPHQRDGGQPQLGPGIDSTKLRLGRKLFG
jgi:hypothetical protein